MEAKLNIANILKDKPSGTKLYADAFGELKFVKVDEVDTIYTRTKEGMLYSFYNDGKYDKNGEPILVPSKEMRDWNKFAWKKGDVLVSNDYGTEVIFDKWYDDTYINFHCKHYLNSEDKNKILYYKESLCATARYSLEDRDAAQTYINTIEERLGGKLNRETLEIEKQTEFKDGDIVVTDAVPDMCYSKCIFILKGDLNACEYHANSYIFYNINNNHISFNIVDRTIKDRNIHLATAEERLKLFDALTKEGKYWDAKKKEVVDLKPKIELKPFDKVLVRDGKDEIWEPAFFFRNRPELNVYKYQTVGGKLRVYCIPFNEGTAKLIGTSNDWEE